MWPISNPTFPMLAILPLLILIVANPIHSYRWPHWTDQLEEYYTQGTFVVDDTNRCAVELAANTGRQTAAEWLRTAFHDMSTHNVHTGLGGLDASLAYELDRDENKGQGLFDTFTFLAAHFMSKYSSASDLLALLVVVAMDDCSGNAIPFRAGRVDARSAGPAGVPTPDQSLQQHITSYVTVNVER
jgi:hypothetical protein